MISLGSRTIADVADMEAFVRAFEAHTLPKSDWTHHSHLAVGLWYVAHYSEAEALDRLRDAIRSYNVAQGGANTETAGYHETITRVYVRHIGEHLRTHRDTPLMTCLRLLLNGPAADREFPLRFYTRERLFSVEARLGWIEPDIQPLNAGDRPAT